MRTLYLLLILLISFQSCSTSNDEPMVQEEDMQMEEMSETVEGSFMSGAHPTIGKATANNDKMKLSFTNFKTDAGPSLEVYLATDASASNYVTLGALQGVEGDYEYMLPNNIDLEVYNHVIIWCVPFSVNFGYAVLE